MVCVSHFPSSLTQRPRVLRHFSLLSIHLFTDFTSLNVMFEIGWQRQEISKFQFCLRGQVKEVYCSLPGWYQNNYEFIKAPFPAMFVVIDDEHPSALKLYSAKQREDQDLNYLIVDIMLSANKQLMANIRAKETFLKVRKHRRETWMVINNGRCATFAVAAAEVLCLLEDYSAYEGQIQNLHIDTFSQVHNAPVHQSHSLQKFSPTRITSKFSARNSPTPSENHVIPSVKTFKRGEVMLWNSWKQDKVIKIS